MPSPDHSGPMLVFGPRSLAYDFGPSHPLTPRRFGPGIELLRALGAQAALEPEPATDAELEWVHDPEYLEVVRALSRSAASQAKTTAAGQASAFGLGPGDTPAFVGMHDAAASVAGGSLRAIEAILAGDVTHAFHPGGGLHHAMPRRASGFCVYNDPALAVARARRAGLRVLYVDLDVHHGDGVQAIHWNDRDVITISFHETGRALFPGTGFVNEVGGPEARGSKLNIPLDPGTGERGWLAAVERVVTEVADEVRPEIVVSQHGSDGHAWDPLAHLRLTTTAMGAAARLLDGVAHRWAGGRWLATGGGGYDAYRVVPRAWSLVWLAGAHRDPPPRLPDAWLERWADDASTFGQSPLPERFEDPPNAGRPFGPADDALDARAAAAAEAALVAWKSARAARGPTP